MVFDSLALTYDTNVSILLINIVFLFLMSFKWPFFSFGAGLN